MIYRTYNIVNEEDWFVFIKGIDIFTNKCDTSTRLGLNIPIMADCMTLNRKIENPNYNIS